MTDDTDVWRALRDLSKTKRAKNRTNSLRLLLAAGLNVEVKNGGAHLIVEGRFDFWPGTGLWIDRTSQERHRGVQRLILACHASVSVQGEQGVVE